MKRMMVRIVAMVFFIQGMQGGAGQTTGDDLPIPRIPFSPRKYISLHTSKPVQVDGRDMDPVWKKASWTDFFLDIEGDSRSSPKWKTRLKTAWDNNYFYILAWLEEPHIWAEITERDAVIFYDNDFEVFIDPDGDSHHYFELEINALGTVWDLFLEKPYRDTGRPMNHWDIRDLKSAVQIMGTLNNPGDIDRGWMVELALPWKVLCEFSRGEKAPEKGSFWRVNFSRVEWRTEVVGGNYRKMTDPRTGKPYAEDNWVWSPQGLINMHYPEMWGYVFFADEEAPTVPFALPDAEEAKWLLRHIYYAQQNHRIQSGRYAGSLQDLGLADLKPPAGWGPFRVECTSHLFEASVSRGNLTWCIRQDGLVWKE